MPEDLFRPQLGEPHDYAHVVRFEPGTQRVVGEALTNTRSVIDRDGRLIVTIPETVEPSADKLAPALAAVRKDVRRMKMGSLAIT